MALASGSSFDRQLAAGAFPANFMIHCKWCVEDFIHSIAMLAHKIFRFQNILPPAAHETIALFLFKEADKCGE